MAQLGGRSIKTLITSLEVLSDDGKDVLMLDRQEDGSVIVKTRKPYESAWSSEGPRFSIKTVDASLLGLMLASTDAQWHNETLKEIAASDFTADKPQSIIDAELGTKSGDCTELDIERAKAANIAEQKELLALENERDHALDKHITADVPGCPACERKNTFPTYGTYDPDDDSTKTPERGYGETTTTPDGELRDGETGSSIDDLPY